MRIATFNLENLDEGPELPRRLAVLRGQLERLAADILCLQEVNGQKPQAAAPRRLLVLDRLLEGTPYAAFARASTLSPDGDPADVHNLVTLARWPIAEARQYRHELVAPPLYRPAAAEPPAGEARPVEWDRPLLHAAVALPGGRRLHVLNLHLRAPLAAPIPGGKQGQRWRAVAPWAEGLLLASIKRIGQAVEARLLVDRLLDAEPAALIVVAGDLNADSHEMPLRALLAETEDTANPELAGRQLHPAEADVPEARRFSVRHHGRRLVLDHLLVSAALRARLVSAAIDNAGLPDEAEDAVPPGSFHAPVVAEFREG
ncbi:MAG: endonuclease/exonuclease/phosphatase family protein [Dongiaceae bacterium]